MIDKEIIERVREDVAKKMAESNPLYGEGDWDNETEDHKEAWRESADTILSHPNIAIIDPDAESPFKLTGPTSAFNLVIHRAAKDAIKRAGWRKTL